MEPTLRKGDLLEISPYRSKKVKRHDIIVFRKPGQEQPLVHRVIAVTPSGVRTQGDNNSGQDPHFLKIEDIVGYVEVAWRGRQRRKIRGGRLDSLKIKLARKFRTLDYRICSVLSPFYLAFARSGIVYRLLPKYFQPRVVAFQANGRRQLRLMIGRRLIGQYEDRSRRWHFHRPFRLLADERLLPGQREVTYSHHPIAYPLESPDTHSTDQ
jgi:signal peptidase I